MAPVNMQIEFLTALVLLISTPSVQERVEDALIFWINSANQDLKFCQWADKTLALLTY